MTSREFDHMLLARLLNAAALIGATIDYCELIKRRIAAREEDVFRRAADESGLQGLVRVFLTEN